MASDNLPWPIIEDSLRRAAARQSCPDCNCPLDGGAVCAILRLDDSHVSMGLLCHCTWTKTAVIEITTEITTEIIGEAEAEIPMPVPTAWRSLFKT